MPGSNQYLPFGIGAGANTLSYATYAAHPLLAPGHQPGVALAEVVNTTFRQATVGVAGLAKFVVDNHPSGADMLDDGSVVNFATKLKAALDKLYKIEVTKAMPGRIKWDGGMEIKFGIFDFANVPSGEPGQTGSVTFAAPFDNACAVIMLTTVQDGGSGSNNNNWNASATSWSATGFSWQIQEWASSVNPGRVFYVAIGW